MSTEYLLPRKHTLLGSLVDPSIPVVVRTTAGDFTYRFLIDTGAEFSVAPRRFASEVGLEWASLPEIRVAGVEQGGITGRLGWLPLRLAGIDFSVRCIYMDVPTLSFLLGRADFLDRFVVTIDAQQQKIILTPIP